MNTKIDKKRCKNLVDMVEDCFFYVLVNMDYDYEKIGRDICIHFAGSRKIIVNFIEDGVRDNFSAVMFRLVDKEKGEINRTVAKFGEVFDEPRDMSHPNKIDKYIWKYNGTFSWYGVPTIADIKKLHQQLLDYMSFWE